MAARVNTKFVIILSTVLLLMILGMVVLWYRTFKVDPAEYIAMADQQYAQGNYDQAASNYAKALQQRRTDTALMLQLADALSQVEVADARAAQLRMTQLIDRYKSVLDIDPRNEKAMLELARLYMAIGRDLGDLDGWNQLYKVTDTMLQSDPQNVLARQYRGISQVARLSALNISADDRQVVKEDLDAALAARPDDPDITFYLARWHLHEATRLAQPGMINAVADGHRATARKLTLDMYTARPDDAQIAIHHLNILSDMGNDAEAQELMARLERTLTAGPAPSRLVLEVGRRLIYPKVATGAEPIDPKAEGLQRAEALIRSAQKHNPKDIRLQGLLGQILAMKGSTTEAMEAFKAASEMPVRAEPVLAYQFVKMRESALIQYANLKLKGIATAEGPQRDDLLTTVEAIIDKIKSETGETGHIFMLQGKVHLARAEWGQALAKLDSASKLFNDVVPDILLLSASACVKLGELGAATTRLERLIERRPDFLPGRYELAKLYLRLAQSDRAEDHINKILASQPNDFEAIRLKAVLYAQSGRINEAVKLYESFDLDRNPQLVLHLARLYASAGRVDDALRLLGSRFQKDPTNLNLLRELVRMSPTKEQAMTYVNAARRAGVDADMASLLESRLQGGNEEQMLASVERLVGNEADPLQRHMNLYALHRRVGDRDKAKAELAEAVRIAPNDPEVLEAQFEEALTDKDYGKAGEIARRAGDRNADLAQGNFFKGRLSLAQGQSREAVTALKLALELRPVYSDGWRLLGDAQRRGGDSLAAISSYERSLEQRPDNITACRSLAATLDAAGKHEQALVVLRRAMQYIVTNDALREEYLAYEQQYGDKQRALLVRKQLASANPRDMNNRRGLAVLLAQMNQFAEARATVAALLKEDGQTLPNLGTAATISAIAGDTEGAKQMLQNHVRSLGANARSEDWLALGRFLFTVNDNDAAVAAYQQAINLEIARDRPAMRELADYMFDRGNFAEAVNLYSTVWDADRTDSRVGYRYVEALIRHRQIDQAEKALAEVVRHAGRDVSAHLLASLIHRQRGNRAEAVAELDRAVAMAPDRAIIYFERGTLRAQMPGSELQAIDDLEKALSIDPSMHSARGALAELHLSRDDRTLALRQMQTVLGREPGNVQVRLQLLSLYLNTDDLLAAGSLLTEARQLFPQEAMWPRLQADVAARRRDHAAAARHLQEAFALNRDKQTLAAWAVQLIASRQPAAAVSVLQQNADLVTKDPGLQATLGRVLIATGKPDDGAAAIARAARMVNSLEEMFDVCQHVVSAMELPRATVLLEQLADARTANWTQMALARSENASGQSDKAASRLKRIEPQIPTNEKQAYRGMLAYALHNSRDYQAAMRAYRDILADDPDNFAALNNLAYLLLEEVNKPQEALEFARRAGEMAPNDPQVLDTLGWAYFASGDKPQALRTLQRSVKIKPFAANSYHLAKVMLATGAKQQATDLLKDARKAADPSSDDKYLKLIDAELAELERQ